MTLNAQALKGGALRDVVTTCMVPDGAQARFAKAAGKPDGKLLTEWQRVLGWTPPRELAEWAGVAPGYRKVVMEVSDVWTLDGDGISSVGKLAGRLGKPNTFNDVDLLVTMTSGLVHFGDDPSGDSCFVSTLGDPKLASMHVFNHENGELEGPHVVSIAAFIASKFAPPTDDGEADDDNPRYAKLAATVQRGMAAGWKRRPIERDAVKLYDRSRWLVQLPGGRQPYEFADQLSRAADWNAWLAERPRLAKAPVLAAYWALAHFFLDNEAACREAIALAKKTPGLATRALAKTIESALATHRLGTLPAAQLAELRDATRRNCDPRMLAPDSRASLTAVRSIGVATLSPAVERQRLAAGGSVWDLVRAYPDDAAAHDRLLKRMVATDKTWKPIVGDYLKARNEHVYDEWPPPWAKSRLPRELSPIVAAAFRAGLKFDVDHKSSNRGLTNTLGHFDDDHAAAAWQAAIDQLAIDDDRLKYILKALRVAKHTRAQELLVRAAERYFAKRDLAENKRKARQKEGPTLDNMLAVDSHLLDAVLEVLRRGGADGEHIADLTLETFHDQLGGLGTALGLAFRVAGERGLARHVDFIVRYIERADRAFVGEEELQDRVVFNLTEAAIAGMQLAPERVRPVVEAAWQRKRYPMPELDIRASLLAVRLAASPDDPELVALAHRALGNRTGAMRIYGALRAVELVRLAAAGSWVMPHVYADRTSLEEGQTGAWVVQAAARAALAALGLDAPAWNGRDEFASNVKGKALIAALSEPHLYLRGHVCTRIVETTYKHPELVPALERELVDLIAFSADDPERSSADGQSKTFRALVLQGSSAVSALARMLQLPHLERSLTATVLLCMRVASDEAEVHAWCDDATPEQLVAQLATPEPRFLPFIDVLAAACAERCGEHAVAAIGSALDARCALVPDDYAGWHGLDPTLYRVPRVLASLGARGRDEVARRVKQTRGGSDTVKTALELALGYDTLPAIDVASVPIELVEELRPSHHGPRSRVTVAVTGARVAWTTSTENLYFEHITTAVGREPLTAERTVTYGSGTLAHEAAARMVQESLLARVSPTHPNEDQAEEVT